MYDQSYKDHSVCGCGDKGLQKAYPSDISSSSSHGTTMSLRVLGEPDTIPDRWSILNKVLLATR